MYLSFDCLTIKGNNEDDKLSRHKRVDDGKERHFGESIPARWTSNVGCEAGLDDHEREKA
jgi:hypothetical protein